MIRRFASLLGSALLGAAYSGVSHVLQRRIGLNLADEGYLWCGARDTAAGAQPIRDFDSYDPVRYWWTAAVMKLRGDDGVLSLRLAAAVWEGAALFAFFRLAPRTGRSRVTPMFEALLLQMWMFPLYRIYDNALPVFTTLALTRLVEKPSPRRFFETGAYASFTALVGRNHGVYSVASLAAVAILAPFGREQLRAGAVALPLGVVCGYAPVFALCAVDRRFRAKFAGGIVRQFQRGSTPLKLPLPWPWRVFGKTSSRRALVSSVVFAALPLVYGLALIARFSAPKSEAAKPSSLAACCVGIVYLHCVYSRAGLAHIASGIFPSLWLACGFGALPRLMFAAATVAMSEYLTPILQMAFAAEPYESIDVHGDMLILPASETAFLSNMRAELRAAGAEDGVVAFVPHYPALYPLFSKPVALYEIYMTPVATEEQQSGLIEQLQENDARFVVMRDIALDQNEVLRMQNSHASFWRYVLEHFERIPTATLPADVLLLRRSEAGEDGTARIPAMARFDDASMRRIAGSGFFRIEQPGGMWATPRVLLKLWIPPGAAVLYMEGVAPENTFADPRGQRVTCSLDSIVLEERALGPGAFEATFELPQSLTRDRATVVEIAFAARFVPSELGDSADGRTLSALLGAVGFR
jgi:hypothetical protein